MRVLSVTSYKATQDSDLAHWRSKMELSIHSHTTVFPTVQDLVIYHR